MARRALCTLIAPLALAAFGAPQADEADRTVIEQALIEHVCTTNRAPGEPIAVHEQCLDAQLIALRANFGRDLSRVPMADRRRIDSTCNPTGSVRDHDTYVGCVNAQLNAWHAREKGSKTAQAAAAESPSTPVAATPTPTAAPKAAGLRWHVVVWATVGMGLLAAGAGGTMLVRQSRRRQRTCRTCGAVVDAGGDLCQPCRREAAEAVRRATAQRAEQAREEEEERQRQHDLEEEQREQVAREQAAAALRERERLLEQARLEEQAREKEARREREQLEREQKERAAREAPATSGPNFDPHQVLGVPKDATVDMIRAAYKQAMAKYHPDEIGFLGEELQLHFEAKAKAVRRAYQMLAGEETPSLTLKGDS